MEMSEMVAWQEGLYLEAEAVNSEQRRKLKKASRDMDSRTLSMCGDEWPEWSVLMHRMRRYEVRGERFGGVWTSVLRRPLIKMVM